MTKKQKKVKEIERMETWIFVTLDVIQQECERAKSVLKEYIKVVKNYNQKTPKPK